MLNHLIASKDGIGKQTESSPSSQKNNPYSRRKSKSPVSSLSPSGQNNNNPSSMMMKTKLPVFHEQRYDVRTLETPKALAGDSKSDKP